MSWFAVYGLSFAISAFLAASLTALARAAAPRLGVLDRPGAHRGHPHPIAVNGGWAVFAAFVLLAGVGGFSAPALARLSPEAWGSLTGYLENLTGVRKELAAILIGTSLIFLVGAIDDVRPLGPRRKLLAQIVSTIPLLYAGISIRAFLPWPPLGWALTAGWLVLLMNSFNFIDNMDGLCATVAATVAAVLALAAFQGGELWLPALFLSFSGVLVGFLFFNFHPATIFLGDSGSLTIGYLVGVFSILTTFYTGEAPSGLPVLIPLAVMGVPLFDTISVMWIRWRAGAPFMVGDRNHFSHRLRALGFSVRQAVGAIALLTAATGLLALPLRVLDGPRAALHLAGLTMLFVVIAALEFVGRRGAG